MFKDKTKIVVHSRNEVKKDSFIVVAQRMQCRINHKRKDC